jgi:hypothetical protein
MLESRPFYVWINAWLPHRSQTAGALVALLDLPVIPNAQSERFRCCLQAVAEHAHLDFLVEERRLPIEGESLSRRQPANGLYAARTAGQRQPVLKSSR